MFAIQSNKFKVQLKISSIHVARWETSVIEIAWTQLCIWTKFEHSCIAWLPKRCFESISWMCRTDEQSIAQTILGDIYDNLFSTICVLQESTSIVTMALYAEIVVIVHKKVNHVCDAYNLFKSASQLVQFMFCCQSLTTLTQLCISTKFELSCRASP